MVRPVTTLFMLTSVDGKISPGPTHDLDVDKDFPAIPGVVEGLYQYYEIEQTTDLWSLNSGRTQAKIGVNNRSIIAEKSPVNFVVLDNTHLTVCGILYLCSRFNFVVIGTANRNHPASFLKKDNLFVYYNPQFILEEFLNYLYVEFGCKQITIQTGATLNGVFLREKLIDYVDIVMAPILIGGKATPTLIDGDAITSVSQLNALAPLELLRVDHLYHSYLRLRYRVLPSDGSSRFNLGLF